MYIKRKLEHSSEFNVDKLMIVDDQFVSKRKTKTYENENFLFGETRNDVVFQFDFVFGM